MATTPVSESHRNDPPAPPPERRLRRFDLFAILLCAIVGLDTLGAAAAEGPEGLVWMVIVALVFFLPYGLLTAELGSTFPYEGGPYVWTKLAFGRFVAGLNQFLYWISNPIWVGGSLCIVALTTFSAFFVPLKGWWPLIAGVIFIWVGAIAVSASVRYARWVPIVGAIARITLLGFFLVSVVIFAFVNGITPLDAGAFVPTSLGLVALFPILIFNYMGLEIPSAASDEIDNPRKAIPAAILRSAATAFLLYGLPILGVLLVLPAGKLTSLGGFIDACRAVFTVYGGSIAADGTVTLSAAGNILSQIAAAGLIIGLFTSGIAWASGLNRSQAVAFADGTGPVWLGRFSRYGSPSRINLLSAVISTIVLIAALLFTSGDAQKYFTAGISLVISTAVISYVLIFTSILVLRRKYPNVERSYRVPGGRVGVAIVAGLAIASVLFGAIQLIWPGLGVGLLDASSKPDDFLPDGFGRERFGYTMSQVVPLAAIVIGGAVLYLFGARTRRSVGPGIGSEELDGLDARQTTVEENTRENAEETTRA